MRDYLARHGFSCFLRYCGSSSYFSPLRSIDVYLHDIRSRKLYSRYIVCKNVDYNYTNGNRQNMRNRAYQYHCNPKVIASCFLVHCFFHSCFRQTCRKRPAIRYVFELLTHQEIIRINYGITWSHIFLIRIEENCEETSESSLVTYSSIRCYIVISECIVEIFWTNTCHV